MDPTGFVVQRRRARQGIPERSKEIHPNRRCFVNELQESLAFNRIRVNMMQKKGRRDRLWNRTECSHDEVDVVQVLSFETPTMRAELSSDRQPARQRAPNAVGRYGVQGLGRSMRITLVQ